MPQTRWIVAFLLIGFFVYVTTRGQLPQFKAAIFGSSGGVDSQALGADTTGANTPVTG